MSTSDFTQRVRQSLSLSTLIGERVKLRRKGRDFTGLCPFHSEKSPSFTVNDTKGFYYCFGCGAKGDHFDFLMQTQGVTFPEAMSVLSEKAHIPMPDRLNTGDDHRQPVQKRTYEWLEKTAQWYEAQLRKPLHAKVMDYVVSRGISPHTVATFRLGYAPPQSAALWQELAKEGATQEDLLTWGLLGEDEEHKRIYDRFRNRLMVPICDGRGRVVAFGGRLLDGQGPKYLNSPETPIFHKGEMLFNHHLAASEARKRQELIVVEGYFDVIGLYDRGIKHAVAPLGTGFTSHQLQLAWSLCSEPTICFDGDEAGQRAASRVLEFVFPLLKPGCSLNFIFLPSGEDPDSFVRTQGAEAFLKLQENKMSLIDYLWHTQMQVKPLTTPERRADFAGRLREVVSSIVDPHVKNAYGQEIRQRLDGLKEVQGRFAKQVRALPQARFRLSKSLPLLQQKILICLALNHPSVVNDDVEVFAAIPFTHEALSTLKGHLVQYFSQGLPLDKEHMLPHLEGVGMADHIAHVIGDRSLAVHAKFCLPDTPSSQVKEGWRELVFQIIKRTEIKQDIQAAKLLLQESMGLEQWQKLKALILESSVTDTGHESDE